MPRYIDADALKDKLIECTPYAIDPVYRNTNSNIDMFTLTEMLDELHAADVVPVVRGEWVLLDECSNAGVYCSICHKAVYRESAWYKNVHIKSKYCPNRGCKMDKE